MLEAHVLAVLVLGVSSFIVGTIPLKLSKTSTHPFFLSLLLCWGGGVLLATSIVHMLAEVRRDLPEYSELIFCGGFLLIYAVDEVLHLFAQTKHSEEEELQNVTSRDCLCSRRESSSSSDSLMKAPPIQHRHRTSYGTIEKLPKRARFYSLSQSFPNEYKNSRRYSSQTHLAESYCGPTENTECTSPHQHVHGSFNNGTQSIENNSKASGSSLSVLNKCHIEVEKPCARPNRSSISGLLTALIVHSILEGCSIGVQTKSTEILLVLGAVACHKLVLSFCIGMELTTAGFSGFKFFSALTAFSIGCPIGISIGVSVTNASDVSVVEAPLQAVAAGSLLYVAVFEVLPRERYKWQHKSDKKLATFFQMISVVFGFGFIVLLSIFLDMDHEDNGTTTLRPPT